MRRGSIGLAMVGVVALLGACSGATDVDAGSTTAPEAGATTTAAPAVGTTSPATTTGPFPASSTAVVETSTTTTPPTIAPTPGTLALTRVVFGSDPYALITNVGSTPVALDGQWLVNANRASPLDPVTLEPGTSAAIVLGGEQPPQFVGITALVDLGTALGSILASGGELGLFSDDVFVNPAAVVDYVAWGAGAHLNSAAAVAAGIWSDGASIELPDEALSISSPGTIGGGVEDWTPVIGG